MKHAVDKLVFVPDDVDLAQSPLAGKVDMETYVLGAFNPGLTRLMNGNLLMMVRVAEALRTPIREGHIHAIRWEDGCYRLDAWPLSRVETSDPRTFSVKGQGWDVLALTSLSWLLPVELTPDGLSVVTVHYDRAIAPEHNFQCYGIEDPRISRIGNEWLMTTCSVSPERHCTTLYVSDNGLDWRFEDILLDHQNKDMLIFEGTIDGRYWAQTRPLGDLYFAYPPGSAWRAGPSINLATSPDGRFWKPYRKPGIRPHAATTATVRIGGGAPPILTSEGWLALWHGVEPGGVAGIYRTYWSLLDPDDPAIVLRTDHKPLLEASCKLTKSLEHQLYLRNIVFTTGIVVADRYYVVASGEADLACRMTYIDKGVFE